MNDDILVSRLAPVTDEQAAAMVSRQALKELAEDIARSGAPAPPSTPARSPARAVRPARRGLAWAAASALAAAAAVAAAVTLSAGQPTPGGKIAQNTTPGPSGRVTHSAPGSSRRPTPAASTTLTAWSVVRSGDGTLKVTIREMADAAGMQRTLQADGAQVVVTASLAWPAACRQWRAGNYHLGDQVVQTENRTGLPSADGAEFLIRPSAIPAGALLWIGLAQTGRPKGVVGPPGPVSFAYLTASQACARS